MVKDSNGKIQTLVGHVDVVNHSLYDKAFIEIYFHSSTFRYVIDYDSVCYIF
jgi:hypothetical protein